MEKSRLLEVKKGKMVEKNTNMLGMVIVGFLVAVIGIALLSSTADSTKKVTSAVNSVNESFAGKLNVAVALANDDLVSVSAVRNTTGSTVPASNYTVNTTGGTITMLAPQVNNTYYADYTYYDDDYVSNSTSRTLVGLIVIFFAVGLIGYIIYSSGINKLSDIFGK